MQPAEISKPARVPISVLTKHVDQTVTIRGWCEKIRTSGKKIAFLEIRATAISRVQVVTTGAVAASLKLEDYLEITGLVKKLPDGARSHQAAELEATQITTLAASQSDYSSRCPADAKMKIKMRERHLGLRDKKLSLITLCRARLLRAVRKTFRVMGFEEIIAPSFVSSQSEGGATLFRVAHPAKTGDMTCYLTQSSQFALEQALPALGKVFCVGSSYRAEKSKTRRHLTEFQHVEYEVPDMDSFEDHLQVLRVFVKDVVFYFDKYCREDGDLLKRLDDLKTSGDFSLVDHVKHCLALTEDIMILTHQEAIVKLREFEIYKDDLTKTFFDFGEDIPEVAERQLIDRIGKIVFLVQFPTATKSFYMKPMPGHPEVCQSCDVEVPGVGEIIGSGVRISDPDQLLTALKAQGLKAEDYRTYLDLRRYGHALTGGMGMGLDRMLTWLLHSSSIREVVTFPSYPGHVSEC